VHFLSPELGLLRPLGFCCISRFASPSWIAVVGGARPWSCYCSRCCWFPFSGDAIMVSSRCRCRNGGDGALLQRERRGCSREDLVAGRRRWYVADAAWPELVQVLF